MCPLAWWKIACIIALIGIINSMKRKEWKVFSNGAESIFMIINKNKRILLWVIIQLWKS